MISASIDTPMLAHHAFIAAWLVLLVFLVNLTRSFVLASAENPPGKLLRSARRLRRGASNLSNESSSEIPETDQ